MKTLIDIMRTLLLALALVFCNSPNPTEEPPGFPAVVQLVNAFPGLTFARPVDFQQPFDDSDRVFVVEQAGVINVFNKGAATSKSVFLDIRAAVDDSGNEEGLLGLAFHPNYQSNGYFYVNYTASGPDRTVISRFKVSGDPLKADPASEYQILTFSQPYSNHNGGQVSFGPDGFLYIGVGDGGSGGDPHGHGQNRATLLGSILRIDVDKEEGGRRYGIPPDNPFAGNTSGYREEIYAYGLRNPWRLSFDAENGRLWTGDVGQNAFEEIDIIEKGGNYGWNGMEGKHCYRSGCDPSGLKLPIWEYGRNLGVSVTGGFVYRGPSVPALTGKYIYADYGTGWVWALGHDDLDNPTNVQLLRGGPISSFGVDREQELYACSFDGRIYRFEAL